MSVPYTVNGITYDFPEVGDKNWGDVVTNWAGAVSTGMLQKQGGSFVLTADVDFGPNFGLRVAYLRSRAAGAANAGLLRLANTEAIAWRNFAADGNVGFGVNADDEFEFDGALIPGTHNTFDLGTDTARWKDFYLEGDADISGNLEVGGDLDVTGSVTFTNVTFSGNTIIGNANTDTLSIIAELISDIIPDVDATYDLGSASKKWAEIHGVALTVTGTTTLATSLTGVVKAVSGVISAATVVNADVSASAAIDFSKLATLTSGNILVGSAGNVATSVAVSGAISMSNAGVTAFTSGAFGSNNISTSGTLAAGATTISGQMAVGTIDAGSQFIVNRNDLSGVSQRAFTAAFSATSAATSSVVGFRSQVGTANAAFTALYRAHFETTNTAKGAASTITRDIAYKVTPPTQGTNNAYITDNEAFTGNWLLNLTGTDASFLGGNLTLGADPAIFTSTRFGISNTVTAAATTNASGISNLTDINGNTAITTGQNIGSFNRVLRTISSTTTDTTNSDFVGISADYRLAPGAAAVYTYSGVGYIASALFSMPREAGAGTASVPRIAALKMSAGNSVAFATRASYISFDAIPAEGTNNAFISNNDTFTGNWFINSSSTAESIFSGHLNLAAQSELRLQDTTGGQYVGLRASGTTTTHTLTFPAAAPAVNNVLMAGPSTATDLVWGGVTTAFTPAVAPAAGAYSGLTYSVQNGNYTRIGNMILFTLQIEISAITVNTASGILNITGLPVAQKTQTNLRTVFATTTSNFNWASTRTTIAAVLASGSSTITLVASGDGVAESTANADEITGGSFDKKIQISGMYFAA